MKRMFFAVSALAALALLAPSAGFAQANNQLGLYTDMTGAPATANVTTPAFTPFSAYLVLTQPYNETLGWAITSIAAFELSINTPANLTTLSFTPAGPAARVGNAPDFIFGIGTPLPVTTGYVSLGTFSFMAMDALVADVFFGPSSVPGIPGSMAIVDGGDPNLGMQSVYPSTNDFAVPVFSVNGTNAVAVEGESWGGVKSLFR